MHVVAEEKQSHRPSRANMSKAGKQLAFQVMLTVIMPKFRAKTTRGTANTSDQRVADGHGTCTVQDTLVIHDRSCRGLRKEIMNWNAFLCGLTKALI